MLLVHERDSEAEEVFVVQPMLEGWTCCISGMHTGLVEGRECELRVRAGLKGSASLGWVLIPALLPVSTPWASQRPVLCLGFPSAQGDNDLMEDTG